MSKLFQKGAQYPPAADIERISKYYRGRTIFAGKQAEIYERATEILKGTPHEAQLKSLYIAVNVMDVMLTKPADLMVAEPPTFESGKAGDSAEQARLNAIVEENDLTQMIHETVIGAGYRGDSFIKTYYAPRADVTMTEELAAEYEGITLPDTPAEPIIEAVDAAIVFPELSRGSRKKFAAVNIAWVEWVEEPAGFVDSKLGRMSTVDVPYLNVERHVPGYIVHERFKLSEAGVVNEYGYPLSTYTIGDRVATGRASDIEPTGIPQLLVHHIPYKTTDDDWRGISGVEKIESVLAAINDRLVQIDYILWKHSDPIAYGPDDIGDDDSDEPNAVRWGGKYIPVGKEDQIPGYMVWNGQLDAAFKELDILLGLVFQMSETPQWLFGTTLSSDKGGTGTSHTDGGAIKARFMPILTKVKRIRHHVDKVVRDALWTAMQLENAANAGVEGYRPYDAVYPKITWHDGIPRDEKAEAEVYAIRTGNKPTVDVKSAIKRMDGLDDTQADVILTRIDDDEARVNGTVYSSVFNEVVV
ncbi:portal protein [Paenibacillus sp. PAMC21692]|uniref:portal protein n=1 Tax=Paenibacillus sp. PAMC21692 TaxID=2762320 RepID=UPI0021C2EBCE|nr:portal protein [Paenibacillus sp. PAMC21692]